MSGEKSYAEIELEKYLRQIDEFIECTHVRDSTWKDEYKKYSDLNQESMDRLTNKELIEGAYFLFGYCSYVEECANRQKVILKWCESQLDKITSKYEKEFGFDKYTKHEAKQSIVIRENSYAAKVEELRLISEARYSMLQTKVFNLTKRGEALMEKSRK